MQLSIHGYSQLFFLTFQEQFNFNNLKLTKLISKVNIKVIIEKTTVKTKSIGKINDTYNDPNFILKIH